MRGDALRKARCIFAIGAVPCLAAGIVAAQPVAMKPAGTWMGRKAAVALTYDDGLHVHLDKVIPVLDSAGFKGTFYLIGSREGVTKRLDDWRSAARNGHELGNHTLFHPCIAVAPGRDYRDWVLPEYDLNNYTVTRYVDEIRMANVFLKALDGKDKRTLALPCGDGVIQGTIIAPLLSSDVAGVRTGNGYNGIDDFDPLRIKAIGVDDQHTSAQLIGMVKKAQESGALLVFLFHGVGGEHRTNIALNKHNDLVRYLSDNRGSIWVAPLREVAEFVRADRRH